MTRVVIFSPGALRHLDAIGAYIEEQSSPARAETFVARIVSYCRAFETFPERGTLRDDIRPGLRTVGYRRRATIAFTVETDAVVVVGVYYGGQDFEADLREAN